MKKFSEAYHLYCEIVEASLQERLGRPLSERERLSIRNTGSLLLLEAFERDLINAPSVEAIVTLLLQHVQTAKEALERILGKLVKQVAGLLLRPLSSEEEQKLRTIHTVEEAMRLLEKLNEVSTDQRENTFQHELGNLSP
ncbi:MAG TPA: hypothetical protein VFV38_38660 [Ktedonobacteraceae bacterium]|nr:hypothetical protein [Ktedonobacteraceae bacterium]